MVRMRVCVRVRACACERVCERLHVRSLVCACVFALTGHMRAHVKLCMCLCMHVRADVGAHACAFAGVGQRRGPTFRKERYQDCSQCSLNAIR